MYLIKEEKRVCAAVQYLFYPVTIAHINVNRCGSMTKEYTAQFSFNANECLEI